MYYQETSQGTKWQLSSPDEWNSLRRDANQRAINWLLEQRHGQHPMTNDTPLMGFHTARSYHTNPSPHQPPDTSVYLTSVEEDELLSFYTSKIPHLIGPHATLPKCRRDAKVAATASLLFRRFFLSNSILIHDPKCLSVAAAFLATKVEDCMLDVRYLEAGTKEMNAHVPMADILKAEVDLLRGCEFDLLVFHPYKMVLALTEDLRVFLKSERGRELLMTDNGNVEVDVDGIPRRQIAGEDLRPMHDAAMAICDDVIVSNLPLLYHPGEVGLAALMLANEETTAISEELDGNQVLNYATRPPKIDMLGYIQSRFQDISATNGLEIKIDSTAIHSVMTRVSALCIQLRELREGKHGCGNHNVDLEMLKKLHKKLKGCCAWGKQQSLAKKKKRKVESEETTDE